MQVVGDCRCSKLARDCSGCGGVVHKDRIGGHTGEGAIGAQGDAAQVVVIANAGKNNRRPRRGFAGGFGDLAVMLRGPGLCTGGRAVVDGDVMSRRSQVAGHRPAHGAESKEGDVECRNRFVGAAHLAFKS